MALTDWLLSDDEPALLLPLELSLRELSLLLLLLLATPNFRSSASMRTIRDITRCATSRTFICWALASCALPVLLSLCLEEGSDAEEDDTPLFLLKSDESSSSESSDEDSSLEDELPAELDLPDEIENNFFSRLDARALMESKRSTTDLSEEDDEPDSDDDSDLLEDSNTTLPLFSDD